MTEQGRPEATTAYVNVLEDMVRRLLLALSEAKREREEVERRFERAISRGWSG